MNENQLHFSCVNCKKKVTFSIVEIEKGGFHIECFSCGKAYSFENEKLRGQLRKFQDLCVAIRGAEEILANTSVGIDVGEHHVEVPYKLLLTRLNSELKLFFGDVPVTIEFTMEPLCKQQTTLLKS